MYGIIEGETTNYMAQNGSSLLHKRKASLQQIFVPVKIWYLLTVIFYCNFSIRFYSNQKLSLAWFPHSLNPHLLWALSPTWANPPTVAQSISPPPGEGQNCQVAGKCIYTTFTINIL